MSKKSIKERYIEAKLNQFQDEFEELCFKFQVTATVNIKDISSYSAEEIKVNANGSSL